MKVDDQRKRVDALLEALSAAGGTDLLLTAGMPPQIRVQGMLRPVEGHQSLTGEDTEAMLGELLTPSQSAAWAASHEYDFSFGWCGRARIRGNAFSQRGHTALALRMMPSRIPSMEELRLPPVLREFTRRHHGLVLVTGPTGSGKSTTLAALINQINHHRACHILTIEDPIEYVYEHQRSAVNQREVGTDTESFAAALRSALREDPDVLLVGEMRDLESMRFALTIAETGHLVFATLHTNDTAQALARIVDAFPAEQQAQVRVQLSAALTGIVYQRLLPRIGGGLIAAHEVLVATTSVRNLIREGRTHQLRNALVTGRREGMVTFEQSLSELVVAGEVDYDEAVARSLHPGDVETTPRPRAGVRT